MQRMANYDEHDVDEEHEQRERVQPASGFTALLAMYWWRCWFVCVSRAEATSLVRTEVYSIAAAAELTTNSHQCNPLEHVQ